MATLTGTKIANTYKQLLQVGSSNTGLTGTLQSVQDGSGTTSPLQLSNSTVNIDGTFQLSGVTLTANASTLNAVADLTGATGIVAVSAGNVYGRTITGGTGITISNADGTEGNPTIALSTTGITVSLAGVKATSATFADTVSAAFFVGDGSGLINVPSAEGGTVKTIEAGQGIKITVNGAVSSSIPVSGTIAVSADQTFGTVSVSTGLYVDGAASFLVQVSGTGATFSGDVSAANLAASGAVLIAGASAATQLEVATVSALTSVNLAAITSINTVTDTINSNVSTVSIQTSVNAAAITSINAVIGGLDYATSAELAATSAALATSIATANTRITSVSDYAVALSATLATSIGTANTRITSVSDYAVALSATLATSIGNSNTNITTNANAITSINTVVGNVSALTSVNSAAITSINVILGDGTGFATDAELASVSSRVTSVSDFAVALSATLATSISNHLPLAGGTLTGTVSGTDFYVSAVAIGVDALLGKQLHIGTAAVADIVSLTDGTSIAVDFNTGQNFAVQLTDNRTLESPTNCVAGQTGSIFVIQDGTGSRTLSYGGNWKFPAGAPPTLSTAISAVDRIDYMVYTSTAVHAIATLDVK